jgi:hypothetical protein
MGEKPPGDEYQPIAAALAKLSRAVKKPPRTKKCIERDWQECGRIEWLMRMLLTPVFLPHESPASPENIRRFEAWIEMTRCLLKLKLRLIREMMQLHGIDPDTP